MNVYIGTYSRLPSTYQEVEYIQSSWTQYIDTGLKVADWYIIKCDTMILWTGAYCCLWWYLWYINWTYWRLYWWTQNNNKRTYWFFNTAAEAGTYNLNEKFNWELSTISWNLYFRWDWNTLGSSTQTYSDSPVWNIWILGWYGDDVSWKWNKWNARMYDYQIYDNTNTLIRYFIPCYRKSDWEIWMYDIVNSVFYTNDWTGTFTKWADVYTNVLQNAYIGEYKWYKPWANTLAYYPFTSSSQWTDQSWNSNDLTASNITYTTLWWVDTAYFAWTNTSGFSWTVANIPQWANAMTISFWAYLDNASIPWWNTIESTLFWYGTGNPNKMRGAYWSNRWSWGTMISQYWAWSSAMWTTPTQQWYHLAIVYNWTKFICYQNWVSVWEWIYTVATDGTTLRVWWLTTWWSGSYIYAWKWWISNFIVEDKVWTADEIAWYYNQTKSNYWL